MTDQVADQVAAQPAAPAAPVEIPASPAIQVQVAQAPVADVPDVVDSTPVVYEKTGDAGLDYALSFIGNLGMSHEHPAVAAAMNGDFSLISAQLATMGDKAKGHEQVVALAKQAYENLTAKASEAEQALVQTAHSIAGGAEQWAAVQEWARANADPQEKQSINAALEAGGAQAKMALNYLVQCYNKASNTSRDPATAKSPTASAAPAAPSQMTAQAYAKAVQDLALKHGGREISHLPEYQQLQQQRLAAKRRGI